MKLSTRGKYGLYAMYYLAAHAGEGPLPLQSISTMGGVPKQYLEQLLGNLRRSRHAAHGCNSDDRIVIAPLDEVHDVPSNDSADTGEQQCAHAQYQQFKNFRVEQQMCVAKYAQQQAEHESRTIQQRTAYKIVDMLHPRLAYCHSEEQGEEQR